VTQAEYVPGRKFCGWLGTQEERDAS